MRRTLPCTLLFLAACGVKVETQPQSTKPTEAPATQPTGAGGPPASNSTTKPSPIGGDLPSLTTTPKPVGMLLATAGTLRSGPVTVEVLEKDGRPYCSFSRRIVSTNHSTLETADEWSDIGGGFHIADEREAPWLVYVHTTHELFAFDGKGGLKREVIVLNPDGTTESTIKQLTADEIWSPGEELNLSLPVKLLDGIDAALAGQ